MDPSSYRDDNGTDQPESYWRRRAITLAAGLTLLGLLAWAFSGGGGKPSGAAAASSSAASSPAAQYQTASPPAPSVSPDASASAGADAAVPGLPTAAASGLPAATATGTGTAASAKAGADPAPTATAAAQSGGACAPSSVVLSLFSTRPSYSVHQLPEFDVYAVSTAPGTCTINLGLSQLHLTVMSAGRVIWDSADCSRGEANQNDQLSRGVPAQTSMTWNRTITLPGCVTLASSARPGTYQAQVRTASVASQVRTFKLDS
jgi:hypothetical protein